MIEWLKNYGNDIKTLQAGAASFITTEDSSEGKKDSFYKNIIIFSIICFS